MATYSAIAVGVLRELEQLFARNSSRFRAIVGVGVGVGVGLEEQAAAGGAPPLPLCPCHSASCLRR